MKSMKNALHRIPGPALFVIVACSAMAGTATYAPRDPALVRLAPAAAAYRLAQLAGASGTYDGRAYQDALRARAAVLARSTTASPLRSALRASATASSTGTAPATINWTEIGPGNVGGRINAIWVDPKNAQHLIVGAAGGGLWQSNDGAATWTAIAEFPGSLAVGAIGQLPNGTLLAGTGDPFNEFQPGDGMFSSSDGGTTWTPIASTAPRSNRDFWSVITSIATNGNGVTLAATWGGLVRSVDGGTTWRQVWPAAGTVNATYDVLFDPSNANVAVAEDENGSAVYSSDGGLTWLPASGLPGTKSARSSLAFDPSTAGSVYALVDNTAGTSPSGEVFHSTDGGKTWNLLAGTSAFVNQDSGNAVGALCDDATGTAECQGNYDNVIAVIPQGSGKPPLLLVGGINVFRSVDGGTTWTETGSWLPSDADYLHADQHAAVYSASTGKIYVGNDGGMFVQAVAGGAWTADNSGLAITQFYSASGHAGVTASKNTVGGVPITPILAGAQDNGMLLYEGYAASAPPQPNDWVPAAGGDGGIAVVDPANGNDLYGEYVLLSPEYSVNGGPFLNNMAPPPDNATKSANFIAPFALVPNAGQASTQMLAGGATLWLGSNIQSGTPTWTALNNGVLPVGGSGSFISAIAIDPNNAANVWVGYDNGAVWHTGNLAATPGPTWTQTTIAGGPSQQVADLWVVPGSSNTVYATFMGLSNANGSVYVTTDGGQTWNAIGANLPPGPVYSLVTHPAYPQILYAGTLTGLYTSIDGGQTWNASSQGPANISVNQLSWFDTSTPNTPVLLAATDGRGAWMGSPAYNPTPTLTSLNPAQLTLGASATLVTLTGTGYVAGSTVTLDGASLAATYVSPTELQVTVPAATLAIEGTHTLVVTNPIPGGGASAGANLTVAYPPPAISSLTPNSVAMGASQLTLTITGSGFQPVSTVAWNGTPLAATYVSGGSLTAVLPAADLVNGENATVTVTTPSPGGGSASSTFAVDFPQPMLSTISPTSVQQGSQSLTLTASGSGFVQGSTIDWNGAPLATTYVSATELSAALPGTDLANATQASVTVVSPTPGGGGSSSLSFTVSSPPHSGGGALDGWDVLGLAVVFGLIRRRAVRMPLG